MNAHTEIDKVGQPMQVTFALVATQTSPMDLRDEVITRTIKDHEKLVEEGVDLNGLEFIKSEDGLEWCHPSIWNDSLAMLPELYEVLTSLSLKGITISPCLREAESKEEGELSPPGAMAQFSPLPSMPILGANVDLLTEGMVVVKVSDKNPSCPFCGNWIGNMSGLIEHLKRVHGKKKILFLCAQCGRTNVKRHSIACHFPKCKGTMESAPVEGWVCGECERVYLNQKSA